MKGKSTQVFQIQDDALICVREDPGEEREIDVETVAGHFRWVASSSIQQSEVSLFEFGSLDGTDSDIEPISSRPQQAEFGTRIREFFNEYEETDLDAITDGPAGLQTILDDIRKGESVPTGEAAKVRPVKPRTTAPTAFEVFGFTDSANGPEFKDSASAPRTACARSSQRCQPKPSA
jgi:hypothetical protein